MECREKSCEAAACWGDEDKIAGTEKSCEAAVVGRAEDKTAVCCAVAGDKKSELCEVAGVEIVNVVGVGALVIRINSVSIRTHNASSESEELSEEYVEVNSFAKDLTQRSGWAIFILAAAIIAELYILDANSSVEGAIIGVDDAKVPEDTCGEFCGVLKGRACERVVRVGTGPVAIWKGSNSGLVDPEENKSTGALKSVGGVGRMI